MENVWLLIGRENTWIGRVEYFYLYLFYIFSIGGWNVLEYESDAQDWTHPQPVV